MSLILDCAKPFQHQMFPLPALHHTAGGGQPKVIIYVSVLHSHGYILHTQARSRSYPTPGGIQKLAKQTVQYLNIQSARHHRN